MSILPARKNFKIWRGSTFHYRFQYLMGSATSTVPQNLTGYTGTLTIKSKDGLTTYATLTPANGGIIFNGASGIIDIVIPASTTATYTWTQGKYEFLVTSGETVSLMTGLFTVTGL